MRACGIDFGTSNSAIALGLPGNVTLLPVEDAEVTLPSALFFPAVPVKAKPVFGRAAQKLFFEGEEGRFMRSLKRILGTPLMEQGTVVNGKPRGFDEIIGHFVAYLKAAAEKQAGALDHVVMGRPVHFLDGDAAGDRRAEAQLAGIARRAGFSHVAFQFEPVAAAFAHERHIAGEKRALVADIGGGTSDFTVIRVSKSYMARADRAQDILGHSGLRLGGNDFDKHLSLARFMPELGYQSTYGEKRLAVPLSPFHDISEWSKVNFLYTPKFRAEVKAVLSESHDPRRFGRFAAAITKEAGHLVLSAVETAKIELTDSPESAAPLGFLEPGLVVTVTRKSFDDAIRAQVARIGEAISACLASAGLRDADIETVILTGGPTETPLLKALIAARFPEASLSEDNKLSSVALGLGYDALRKFGA